MHIPDGILSIPVSAGCYAASVVALAASGKAANRALEDRAVPLAGVAGAFVFAAQMVNIPIPGGTSGHLMGGALLSLILGLAPAMLVMAAVVTIQCLIFQDGGLLALGANILNMAVVGPAVGFATFRALHRLLPRSVVLPAAGALAGWLSLEAGALLAGLQMGLSGTLPTSTALLAMGSVHAVIGAIEAGVTAAALQMIALRRGDLLLGIPVHKSATGQQRTLDTALLATAALSLLLSAVVAHFASQAPDGLEHVMAAHGIKEGPAWPVAPLPDYTFPWLRGWAGKSLAAVLGLTGTAFVAAVLVRLVRRRRRHRPPPGSSGPQRS